MRVQSLLPCDDAWGNARLISPDPELSLVSGAVYVPFRPGAAWGIFDKDGVAISEALDFHGPERILHSQLATCELADLGPIIAPPDDVYIYGGQIHYHFGHFIINTLSRFWPYFDALNVAKPKFLMHGPSRPEEWFTFDFVRDAFTALNIDEQSLVVFDRPVRIPRLIVPAPAFEDNQFAHQIFRVMCRRMGDKLMTSSPLGVTDRPVYFTKSSMTTAAWKYSNEQIILDKLERSGVDILVPETLSLGEKVEIYASRKCVSGLASSGMHSSVFSPQATRSVVLNAFRGVNSNFHIFDLINRAHAEYLYAAGAMIEPSEDPRFSNNITLSNPEATADELLEKIFR